MRGPLVYCFEGVDNDPATQAILLGQGDVFQPVYKPDLLGGIVQLEGRAGVLKGGAGAARREQATVKAIPFFTYQNRSATTTDVWMADAPETARPSGGGVAEVSYCNPSDTAGALNDAILPRSSDDDTLPRMTWWNRKGTMEWAQITYGEERDVSSVAVYWWDERRVGRECRVPQSWSVQYLDGGTWKSVTGATVYGVEMDRFNQVNFTAVRATGIRVLVQLQSGWSGGILEMIAGAPPAVASASQTFAGDTVAAINDGRIPAASDDEGIPRHTFWNHVGTREWVQLTYAQARTFSALEVYWWDERRIGRDCRVPQSWNLQYLDNGVWKPVATPSGYGVEMDRFNRVEFTPVTTTALRLDIQLQSGWSAGVLEMRALEPGGAAPFTGWLAERGYDGGVDVTAGLEGGAAPLLAAYALGLEPGDALPLPQRSEDGVSLFFWGGREDVLYSAEWSADLRGWSSWGVSLGSPDATGRRSVELPVNAAGRGFLRLKFATPDAR